MRRTMLMAATVLVTAVALILTGTLSVNRATQRAGMLLQASAEAARWGDLGEAFRQMTALEGWWRQQAARLELMTSHDALADVRGGILDALLCLSEGERVEFLRSCVDIGMALERLRAAESPRLMNLF